MLLFLSSNIIRRRFVTQSQTCGGIQLDSRVTKTSDLRRVTMAPILTISLLLSAILVPPGWAFAPSAVGIPDLEPRDIISTRGGTTWDHPLGWVPLKSTATATATDDDGLATTGGGGNAHGRQTTRTDDAESSRPTTDIESKTTDSVSQTPTLATKTRAPVDETTSNTGSLATEESHSEEDDEGKDSHLPLALIIGLGIGIPLTIIVIVAIVVSFWRATWRDKKSRPSALTNWDPTERRRTKEPAKVATAPRMDARFGVLESMPPGGYPVYGAWSDSTRNRPPLGY